MPKIMVTVTLDNGTMNVASNVDNGVTVSILEGAKFTLLMRMTGGGAVPPTAPEGPTPQPNTLAQRVAFGGRVVA